MGSQGHRPGAPFGQTAELGAGAERQLAMNVRYVAWVTMVGAIGGLLFGYDWVVIGGAKKFYELYFGLDSAFYIGWAMNSAVMGCIMGAMLSGALSDKYGRKRLLLLASILFTWSAIGTGLADTFSSFMVYRWIGGLGMGLASALSPVYIAEISPAAVRGRTVTMNQVAINIGVLSAQIANWFIGNRLGQLAAGATNSDILKSWVGQQGWRWMFWAETIPAALFFFLLLTVPESPRWLVKMGRGDKARDVLARVGGDAYARLEVADIRLTLQNEIGTVRYRDLIEPGVFRIVLVGIFLAVFQQWCGINVVFQYAQEIFEAAGYGMADVLTNIVWQGVVMLLATGLALATVDRIGRRSLMLLGSSGLAVAYLLLGYQFYIGSTGLPALVLVLVAIAVYSLSLAPITWVLLSEIFPNRIRGAAMSIAALSLWVANGSMTLSFPYFHEAAGMASTLWLYAIVCFAGFGMVWRYVPETRGKSLETIEREFVDRSSPVAPTASEVERTLTDESP